MANSDLETADAKNRAMRDVGFVVSDTFEELPVSSRRPTRTSFVVVPSFPRGRLSRSWDLSGSQLLSSRPSPMRVDRSFCSLV
jgi:hypothetical protein